MVKMQQRQFGDEPMKAINFRVPESLYEQIKKTSKEQRKSISLLLAQIIEDALMNKTGNEE
jgi:predicted HicB family RNase H-like nuclease